MQLAHIDFLDEQIATLTMTMAERLSTLPPPRRWPCPSPQTSQPSVARRMSMLQRP
jgi:hypothetical protein